MHTVREYIVDRIEDDRWVVLESTSGGTIDVPVDWVPEDVSEGDILRIEVEQEKGTSSLSFTIDDEATAERRRRLREKRNRLRRGPQGDLRL